MHILLLAPHPFYQERGTPIAVDLLLHALAKRGDRVDVLTYHEGEDRDYGPSVKLHRIRAPRFIRRIRPGFSLGKLFCDVIMSPHAMRLARAQRYDCIHAVEESVFIARWISRRTGTPYVFDMDSSMPRQIVDKLPFLAPLLPPMRAMERRAIRGAAAVVPMCDALADEARQAGATFVEVLRDISLVPAGVQFDPDLGFRKATRMTGPAALYIGNLEPYQGIGLLLESTARVAAAGRELNVVIVGGRDDDIQRYRLQSAALGIADRIHFLGPRPIAHMAHLFHDADMLVSPRTQGQNTPMKIYSYLDAGCPLLATRLPTHTQVLDDEVAMLAEPTPDAMALAMTCLLDDKPQAERLAGNARRLAQARYSRSAFENAVNQIYDHLSRKKELTSASINC
jgi:glycosyltransferase involved in cell wall biosynthesis